MESEYIFEYRDAQDIHYPRLKFIQRHSTPMFGIFQRHGDTAFYTLSLDRIYLNDDGRALTKHQESCDPWSDVVSFHQKFGIDYQGSPRTLDPDLEKFRDVAVAEELQEFRDARDDQEKFDAGIDAIYFILGYFRLRGWPFPEGWRRVHEKNMQKVLAGDPAKSKRGHGSDVIKPPGWTPPDLSDLVRISQ